MPLHATKMGTIKARQKVKTVSGYKDVKKLRPSYFTGMSVKCCNCCGKVWRLKMLEKELSHDTATQFPCLCPKQFKTSLQIEAYTWIFTASLFTIAKSGKDLSCPSTGECTTKMWCIHAVKLFIH